MHKTHNHRITRAKEFGDLSTADHKVLNEEGESRSSDRYVVIPVQNLATDSEHKASGGKQKFFDANATPKVIPTQTLR